MKIGVPGGTNDTILLRSCSGGNARRSRARTCTAHGSPLFDPESISWHIQPRDLSVLVFKAKGVKTATGFSGNLNWLTSNVYLIILANCVQSGVATNLILIFAPST